MRTVNHKISRKLMIFYIFYLWEIEKYIRKSKDEAFACRI
ncbi:hypothetical protein Cabys_89 [Caldithrix abyssi DSM 13497]|uniref:Uncharacterized protein n=1 Tax=Caldithrix abyssi DSM 13497 TaxID=880073 RepID=A0A1J1C4M1_CALAY|nr:hypothetical protein Cabys_89 [Caldithrix abyssi DSM 13497]